MSRMLSAVSDYEEREYAEEGENVLEEADNVNNVNERKFKLLVKRVR